MRDMDETDHSLDKRWSQEGKEPYVGRNGLKERSGEDGVNARGPAPCCSLGLGVYGNGSKHNISPAASGTTPASNDSAAAQ